MKTNDAFWAPLDAVELPLLQWVAASRGGPRVQQAAHFITKSGEHAALWHTIALVGQLVDGKRRSQWRRVNISVLIAYFLNTGLKLVARRHRPPTADVQTPTALSFPSAHAATAAAAGRTMRGLVPRAIVVPLTALVPATRIYFGVHYPTDILAGGLIGDLIGRATLRRWPIAQQQR
ncbi:MAG: phosphatase PAP2 family protein [Thermoleophilaceae bacterium]|nr:phosphatase PAP2 family protein [Thermoleophilaceae bacterium]